MTNTFRKHHKTIMWIIIVGTIISFVYFLSPSSRNSGGGGAPSGPAANLGSINGEPITQQQMDAALRQARVFYFFRAGGRWPDARAQADTLKAIAYQSLFMEAKMREMNIVITPEATARFTKQIFGLPQDQPFPKDQFAQFVATKLNRDGGVGLEDFESYVRVSAGQDMLLNLFGMSGQLITQKEAESFFRRDNETMAVELAWFPVTNYTASIAVTSNEVAEFYAKNQAAYALPEREQINYIEFDYTNYSPVADQVMLAMTNLDSLVDQSYASTDPASFKDEAGNQLSETNAKAKMKRDYHDQVTRHAAQTNSYDFMTRLLAGHDKDHPITQPHLAAFAATNGLKVVTTEPFDVQNPPATLQIPAQLHPMLFQLEFGDPDDQYKVFPATNAFLLVGLEKKYPAESQPLEAVRAKVTEDCRLNQAMELVKNAGNKFEAAARAGLAAGQSFDAICASQGIKPQVLTPFALTTRSIPEIDDKDLYQGIAKVAYQLPTGQPSPFLALATGGLIVCVQSRTPLDDAIVERDIPAFLAQRRRDLQIAAFSLWLGKELRAHVMEPQKAAPPS